MYKLGIDVGGTNTDAVLIDENLQVVAAVKNPTSGDIYMGIMGAVDAVLDESGVDRTLIGQAMLGTTQCTNAIVERKGLAPIAILRIGAPATVGIPPMVDWADDIAAVCVDALIIEGGFEYDGKRLAEFDEAACRAFFEGVRGRVEAVAVSSVFSTVRNDDELRAAEIAREVLGEDVHVSISSEIGSMGLIERENATILNAALYDVARRFTEGFAQSLADKGVVNAEVYLSQNDGTLMTMEHARRYPILTIACGPTNSIRGASYLSRRDDAIVIDVGGTTTDLGVLAHGFPRESMVAVEIGDVRTNFRMPDLVSVGLGGGSLVRQLEDGSVTVGPDSVGYLVTKKARCFGGDTLTATDIVVAKGLAEGVGDPTLVADLEPALVDAAYAEITRIIEDAVDAMKTSAGDVTVILVGGGSILAPDQLEGSDNVLRPENFGVANAVGSAIAQVSGQIAKVFSLTETPREQALAESKQRACDEAIEAGADPSTVEVVDVEDIPMAYLGDALCIRVKAVGDLML